MMDSNVRSTFLFARHAVPEAPVVDGQIAALPLDADLVQVRLVVEEVRLVDYKVRVLNSVDVGTAAKVRATAQRMRVAIAKAIVLIARRRPLTRNAPVPTSTTSESIALLLA